MLLIFDFISKLNSSQLKNCKKKLSFILIFFEFLVNRLLCIMHIEGVSRGGSMAVSVGIGDRWQVTGDR